jgi:hypothetical protein
MVAIFAFFIQFAGKSQSLSFAPYAGLCLDQEGILHSYDPVVGLTALAGLAQDRFSIGLDMNGGQRYRYETMIKSKDLKRDSSVIRTTNAPGLQIYASVNIPTFMTDENGEQKLNPLAGPIVGFAYGYAFPDIDHQPVNAVKVFLQGNYLVKKGDLALSIFARPSFNMLYGIRTNPSWDISFGLRLTIPNSLSSAERY